MIRITMTKYMCHVSKIRERKPLFFADIMGLRSFLYEFTLLILFWSKNILLRSTSATDSIRVGNFKQIWVCDPYHHVRGDKIFVRGYLHCYLNYIMCFEVLWLKFWWVFHQNWNFRKYLWNLFLAKPIHLGITKNNFKMGCLIFDALRNFWTHKNALLKRIWNSFSKINHLPWLYFIKYITNT